MNKNLNLSILFLMLILIVSPSLAIDLKIHGNNSSTQNIIIATGDIETNDTIILHDCLVSLPRNKDTTVYFNIKGGNLHEGMRMGKYIYKNKIKTYIEDNGTCGSACTWAFFGGRDDTGSKGMSMATNSSLLFHAFDFKEQKYENEDVEEVLKIVSTIIEYTPDYDFFREMLISFFSSPYLEYFFKFFPTDLTWNTKIATTFDIVAYTLKYSQYIDMPMEVLTYTFSTPRSSEYRLIPEKAPNVGIKIREK